MIPRPPFAARLRRALARFARREDGGAMVELVIVMPVIMLIFTVAFESGMYMTRQIMLERAVDMTVRDLRLGRFAGVAPANMHEALKVSMCDRAPFLQNCDETIRIELTPVSTQTWVLPAQTNQSCFDRDQEVNPSLLPRPGVANDLMLVRVCVIQDSIFPGSPFSQSIKSDDQGGYRLVSINGFVNEP